MRSILGNFPGVITGLQPYTASHFPLFKPTIRHITAQLLKTLPIPPHEFTFHSSLHAPTLSYLFLPQALPPTTSTSSATFSLVRCCHYSLLHFTIRFQFSTAVVRTIARAFLTAPFQTAVPTATSRSLSPAQVQIASICTNLIEWT